MQKDNVNGPTHSMTEGDHTGSTGGSEGGSLSVIATEDVARV